ncbi:MAG: hypothetical protein AB7D05_10005 [Mangrovibacterium sp.]
MRTKTFKQKTLTVWVALFVSAGLFLVNPVYAGYVITPMVSENLASGVTQAWELSYEEGSPVLIELHCTGKEKVYLVRTGHFEVAYVCSRKGFGARKVKLSESKIPESLTSRVINDEALARQRILCCSEITDEMAVGLIADYLPDIINPEFRHLFEKN